MNEIRFARTVCGITETSALPKSGWPIPKPEGTVYVLDNMKCFRQGVSGETETW